MGYQPQTLHTRRIRDAILSALREHVELSTTELADAIGWMQVAYGRAEAWCESCREPHPGPVKRRMNSATIQPTMVAMERHDEIVRWRDHPSQIWRWRLGEGAPAQIDVSELEALLS